MAEVYNQEGTKIKKFKTCFSLSYMIDDRWIEYIDNAYIYIRKVGSTFIILRKTESENSIFKELIL